MVFGVVCDLGFWKGGEGVWDVWRRVDLLGGWVGVLCVRFVECIELRITLGEDDLSW